MSFIIFELYPNTHIYICAEPTQISLIILEWDWLQFNINTSIKLITGEVISGFEYWEVVIIKVKKKITIKDDWYIVVRLDIGAIHNCEFLCNLQFLLNLKRMNIVLKCSS